jgi:hypothetical protein
MDRGPLALHLESWAFRVGLQNRWGEWMPPLFTQQFQA